MKRLIIAVVLALTVILPGLAISPSVSAEAGCGVAVGTANESATQVYVTGSFNCMAGDTGARQLQVCVIVNGTWWDCDTLNFSGTSGGVTAECHRTGPGQAVYSRGWYWFYGEDGSVVQGYGNVGPLTARCDYGID